MVKRFNHLVIMTFYLLYSLISRPDTDIVEEPKRQLFALFAFSGIPILYVFGFSRLISGELLEGLSLILIGTLFLLSLISLRIFRRGASIFRINCAYVGFLFFFLALFGGEHGSKILWMYIYPLVAFFLLGRKEAFYWTSGFFVMFIFFLFVPNPVVRVFPYAFELKMMFMASYALVIAMAFSFESVREKFQKGMEQEHDMVEVEKRNLVEAKKVVEGANERLQQEVAERKRGEILIKEREELFKTVLESTGDGILVSDENIIPIHLNSRFAQMWNIPQEILDAGDGIELTEWVMNQTENPDAFISRIMQNYYSSETTLDTVLLKDGRAFEHYSSPLVWQGKFAARVWSCRDVTERKRAEESIRRYQEDLEELVKVRTIKLQQEISERRQAEDKIKRLNQDLEQSVRERTKELEEACKELKELDKMKDSFLSSVSHELRTPLTSIRSFSEILLRYQKEDIETQQEFLEIINSESERLTRLINDVLDLAHIESGRMVWQDTPMSIEKVITDAAKAQNQSLKEKSLCLSLDFSPGLPLVSADHDRIYQVVTNLLGNAIKFSSEGGEISIKAETLKGKRSGDFLEWIKVSVSDKGIGIKSTEFMTIFDKFRQGSVDYSNEKPKGTGLGLPICKEIITHYGGSIWVESQKGVGSTFFFTLPVSPVFTQTIANDLPQGKGPST